MRHRALSLPATLAFAAALALAGCGTADDENAQNAAGNDTDPALTSALEDQILVDPALTQQSNANAVRSTEAPAQAPYPSPGGGNAAAAAQPKAGQPAAAGDQHARLANAARGGGGNSCVNAPFDYNPAWANRLSPAFPVYPGAKITEAAGNNQGDCRVRVVSFTTADPWQRVLDWYHTKAVRGGYSSEQQIRDGDRVLAGVNESDGGAFYLIVTPKQQGAEVALISNNGR